MWWWGGVGWAWVGGLAWWLGLVGGLAWWVAWLLSCPVGLSLVGGWGGGFSGLGSIVCGRHCWVGPRSHRPGLGRPLLGLGAVGACVAGVAGWVVASACAVRRLARGLGRQGRGWIASLCGLPLHARKLASAAQAAPLRCAPSADGAGSALLALCVGSPGAWAGRGEGGSLRYGPSAARSQARFRCSGPTLRYAPSAEGAGSASGRLSAGDSLVSLLERSFVPSVGAGAVRWPAGFSRPRSKAASLFRRVGRLGRPRACGWPRSGGAPRMRWRFWSPLVCGGCWLYPIGLAVACRGWCRLGLAGRVCAIPPYRALRPAVECGFAGATVSSSLSVRVGLFYIYVARQRSRSAFIVAGPAACSSQAGRPLSLAGVALGPALCRLRGPLPGFPPCAFSLLRARRRVFLLLSARALGFLSGDVKPGASIICI